MDGLILRAPEEADAPALAELLNLPGVRRGTARLPFNDQAFVLKRIRTPQDVNRSIIAVLDGRPMAWGSLEPGTGRRAHSAGLGPSVHDDVWGRGIGRDVLAALLDLADNWLGLRRIELDVMADNSRAISLYEQAGFEREGLARAAVITDGALADLVLMARLRSPLAGSGNR